MKRQELIRRIADRKLQSNVAAAQRPFCVCLGATSGAQRQAAKRK